MDENTASVLKSLVEVGGLAACFWAVAFFMRWQGFMKREEDELTPHVIGADGKETPVADDEEDLDEEQSPKQKRKKKKKRKAQALALDPNSEVMLLIGLGVALGFVIGFSLGIFSAAPPRGF